MKCINFLDIYMWCLEWYRYWIVQQAIILKFTYHETQMFMWLSLQVYLIESLLVIFLSLLICFNWWNNELSEIYSTDVQKKTENKVQELPIDKIFHIVSLRVFKPPTFGGTIFAGFVDKVTFLPKHYTEF